ncbi:MAG: maltose/maltodextrin transport system permease protein, partial [Gaiellaceae bacterium]|nr:maltose/maltodextrin transport system permease protein [Gaiellaceae bacterium]
SPPLTTSTPPTNVSRPSVANAAWALPTRLISIFSGTVGLAVKLVLLAISNAIGIWAATVLAGRHNWPAVAALALVTLAIDAVYLIPRRTMPLKFLVPGTLFLLAFQVIPVIYTVDVAFTNYSTGHILAKDEAVGLIKVNSLGETGAGQSYAMTPARDGGGQLVLLLVSDPGGKTFVGTKAGLKPLPAAGARVVDGAIVSASGYTIVKGTELAGLDQQLRTLTVPVGGDKAIRAQGFDAALVLAPTLRYDAAKDEFIRISDGRVFRDNGKGSFTAGKDELEPGWTTNVGFANFDRLLHNPLVRKPFLRVFIWTLAFAAASVFLSFVVGLFLATVLDKRGMRFQRVYRTILIIPYAIPGFLSLLVWQGLLNDDFGPVNKLLHIHIPWLFDANWAKVAVILVSVWLTFPYFFLISMGALQGIPAELTEAARVDGGGPWQVFRKVTLPLLLVAVTPLLIASFAFNFNNFGNIYLLTGGGPAANDQSIAGATDILISYTYKLAFASGKGNDYGLATAISIVIFFIVATISTVSFWRTRSLENVR